MGGIRCTCGWILKDTVVPNEVQYWVHRDHTSLGINKINDYEELLDSYDYEVWHCQKCDRLHVLDRESKHLKIYRVESTEES